MTEATSGQGLPPGLDLLWGRRERGRRGPQPGLSADAIVEAAVRLADAEGLDAVSMARVAAKLGFTTMALYRYVGNKEELLQLMWNASALGAESLVIDGDGWRDRLRAWAVIQRDMLDRHPWVTQMPMAAPPVAPNSLHFVERGLQTMDSTGLTDADKLRIIGLLSSYTLSEARMAADARHAAEAATSAQANREGQAGQAGQAEQANQTDAGGAAAREAAAGEGGADRARTDGDGADEARTDGNGPRGAGTGGSDASGNGGVAGSPDSYEALLRELVDQRTYPRLYRLAWAPEPEHQPTEREQFLFGIDLILDGVQALIDRAG